MILYASFIVCRMKDTSRKNNMFAQFRKNERDKQKLIDTVVKQLRNLIATNQAWESHRISTQPHVLMSCHQTAWTALAHLH